MAIFVGHSDESGTEDAGRSFLGGGVLASEKDWPYLANAWQERVLDGPPTIPYLHMREVRNAQWRRKYGLKRLDAEDRIDEAVRIIYASGFLSCVMSEIERDDLEDILHRKYAGRSLAVPAGVDQADYFCFLGYVTVALAHMKGRYPEMMQLDFVVDMKSEIADHIKAVYLQIKQQLGAPLDALMGELYPANKETRLPLQAADVFCWHWQRSYGAHMTRRDAQRWWCLQQTIGQPHKWEKANLEDMAEKLLK